MEISHADKRHLARAKRAGNRTIRWTDEEILDAIRRADADGASTSPGYQTWASRGDDRPSFRTITTRYKTWKNARSQAGFTTDPGEWTWRTTDKQHIDAVVQCARELGKLPSLIEYRNYRQAKGGTAPEMPSDALIRTALHGWGRTLDLVRAELERH